MNKKHLIMLADYLDDLPEDYEHFDMEDIYISESERGECLNPLMITEISFQCGTVACAMGHTPLVNKMPHPFYGEVWSDYVERVYSLEVEEDYWCFGAEWKDKDNTHKGAAARIRQLVSDGGVPDDWWEQIHCPDQPLSYYGD